MQGRALGRGARVRALRRDDGRDRRVRAAGPLPVGRGLPRPGVVVYGHTPVPDAEWLNNTISIDTGCVFGGRLTALRWPERELVSVAAARTLLRADASRSCRRTTRPRHAQRATTTCSTSTTSSASASSRRGSHGTVTIREENAAAALEVMSRFAVDPKLARLPAADDVAVRDERARTVCSSTRPRRSPTSGATACAASCARRSTWARARSSSSAATTRSRARGSAWSSDGGGVVYTRTGRRVLRRRGARGRGPRPCARRASTGAGLWDELDDRLGRASTAELMPWSAKAQELLRTQYAAVGAAARRGARAEAVGARRAGRARGRRRGDARDRQRDRAGP